jgi:hypothetical protein
VALRVPAFATWGPRPSQTTAIAMQLNHHACGRSSNSSSGGGVLPCELVVVAAAVVLLQLLQHGGCARAVTVGTLACFTGRGSHKGIAHRERRVRDSCRGIVSYMPFCYAASLAAL